MRTASFEAADMSNLGGAKTCTDFPETCTASALQIAITDLLKAKFPQKTWTFVGEFFGLKERAAKHRLANARCYTIEELQVLLQSEDGLDFLAAIMADAEPKWWWWAKQVMTVASIKRRRHEDEQEILKLETSAPAEIGARRRIKGALDANRNIKAAVDRAETALGVQRPNLDGRDADAAGAGARLSGRSVAPAKRAYAGRGR